MGGGGPVSAPQQLVRRWHRQAKSSRGAYYEIHSFINFGGCIVCIESSDIVWL